MKKKVYIYTRVSTLMQVDGYSLEAQKSRMRAYCDFNNFEIAGEYEDAGKSGKSIEGRLQFNQMIDDIKSEKDGVSFVLVFKLSRFGRNAADVLSTLQIMQDFGVNLICVEDGIDSSKDAGKLMISVLSAVAEIERENIRIQTMEGRMQKAREGRWNGGFAPYGYCLNNGELEIVEEEAETIRLIFDKYTETDMGANGVAKYLADHGIEKIIRHNGKLPLFDAHLIRLIIRNPVYCGKIAFGRRKTEKIHGTRNDYHMVKQDDYLVVDGKHKAIITEEQWNKAQIKINTMADKYEHLHKGSNKKVHLLSGVIRCPKCGGPMYGNVSIKKKTDGTLYKNFYYYACKHRNLVNGQKCDFKNQVNEEVINDAVIETISKIVDHPKFSKLMNKKIDSKVDTSAIEQEIESLEKQLRQACGTKVKIIEEIDSLDPDDKHYINRKSDLDNRLYKMYDRIEEIEKGLIKSRAQKQNIDDDNMISDNIFMMLSNISDVYSKMDDSDRSQLLKSIIAEIHIHENRQANGQWLKEIIFKLPILKEPLEVCLDNGEYVEVVSLLTRR